MTRIVLMPTAAGTPSAATSTANTVHDPHAARIAPFDDARYTGGALRASLPAMSVVAVQIG